ncbi:MAG: PqqD family protein [Gemmatimonadales bacterium]
MAGTGRHPIDASTRVVASRNQLSTKLSGEAVILGLRDSVYYGLSGSGARIWELVQQPAALCDVARAVSLEFDVGMDEATRDLMSLADDLLARGLLDVVPDAAS